MVDFIVVAIYSIIDKINNDNLKLQNNYFVLFLCFVPLNILHYLSIRDYQN